MADDQIDPQALASEVERLRAELAEARRFASEEAQRANVLDSQVSQAAARTANAQVAQLAAQETAAENAYTSTTAEIEALGRELSTLMGEGKFTEASQVQIRIGQATARQVQYQANRDFYKSQREQMAGAPTDPVEIFLQQNSSVYSAQDADWIRANRRYATDQNFRARVMQAHQEALDKGLHQRTPEYYAHLEARGYGRAASNTPPPPAGTSSPGAANQPPPEARGEGGAAPTGYAGEDPTSGAEEGPQIIIEEEAGPAPAPPPSRQGSDMANNARDAAPENPQQRAAGAGSMRQALAGIPTRRSTTQNGRQTILRMTPEQRETALSLAPHMAPASVLEGGEPAILQWYADQNNSSTAQRLRESWRG